MTHKKNYIIIITKKVHSRLVDTLILRTAGAKSPAEITKKCTKVTPAVTNSRYYGMYWTLHGPKLKFLLFCSNLLQQASWMNRTT